MGWKQSFGLKQELQAIWINLRNEENDSEKLLYNLDTLNEATDEVAMHIAAYQQKSRNYYNKHLKLRSFEVGQP